tara:strand:+ start:199 stop:2175 length:1977 start_codon:yes stop_codon:yes gene_type:complete
MKRQKSLPKGVTKQPSIGFVNLSTYTSPEVKEVKNKDWVEYGADNNYFQFLIDRYNGSATNNAAINGISQAIYGKGLNATDANKKPDQYAQMISMFGKDCVRKLSYDLKLMGQCAAQIIYSKDRKKIVKVEHFPIETLRAEKANEEGDVPAYYYFKDWTNIKPSDTPLRIPAFGMSKEDIEILYIKPYKAGFYYYSPVDYQGGLQYCELEEEISNYHINNVMHGLAPSMLINFNNGTPNQEERELLESKIAGKFSGTSNAGKFILAFNDNAESKADITPVQLSDAHNQYQFLSTEATQKIMVAHRVVSPMLLGIKDNSGLGNNAEEIKTASLLMDNTVIRPFQELLIDSFDQILAYNDIALNLYFVTLQPLEFTEVDTTIQSQEDIEEETGVQMSKISLKEIDGQTVFETKEEAIAEAEKLGCEGYHTHMEGDKEWFMACETHDKASEEIPELTDEMGNEILAELEGEVITDEWELVDEREYEGENLEEWATQLIQPSKSKLQKFADQITGKPKVFSVLDKNLYKIRYKYFKKSKKAMKSGNESRLFCSNMMKLAGQGIIYRIEDIDKASDKGINKRLGHKGKPYNLFKFKGGIYCRHAWKEQLYRLKKNTEKTDDFDKYKRARTIPKSYKPSPRGWKEAQIAPVNMPNQGAYPTKKK